MLAVSVGLGLVGVVDGVVVLRWLACFIRYLVLVLIVCCGLAVRVCLDFAGGCAMLVCCFSFLVGFRLVLMVWYFWFCGVLTLCLFGLCAKFCRLRFKTL